MQTSHNKDALRLGLPFHLDTAYLDPVLGQNSPYTRFSLRSSAKRAARVRCVNEGHARLRKHLPQELEDKRLSKVETLRVAIYYINVEPAGLVSGWRCRLETRVTAPLQQRSECSNDGEYSLKLAQPYKSPGPNIRLRRPCVQPYHKRLFTL
uniref:BHLH domain-containing protein n=1 Tax=Sparus aurata TaxID=8175 RepID=A0A671U066_SPAAU